MIGQRYAVILVHGTSHAIRAEQILHRAGISSKLILHYSLPGRVILSMSLRYGSPFTPATSDEVIHNPSLVHSPESRTLLKYSLIWSSIGSPR